MLTNSQILLNLNFITLLKIYTSKINKFITLKDNSIENFVSPHNILNFYSELNIPKAMFYFHSNN